MKNKLLALLGLSLLAIPGVAQVATSPTEAVGAVFSPYFNYGVNSKIPPLRVITGTTSTGTGTVTLTFGYFTTPDGKLVSPFTNISQNGLNIPPITIDSGANQETVTPSAVSCQTPQVYQTCQITATFSNVHGVGAQVVSGDVGITEAINFASLNGGGNVYWYIDSGDPLTLSTASQSTTFGTNIPTRSFVQGASLIVKTTITGCSGGWSLGYSSGTEFGSANTTLTAGTTTDSSTLSYNVAYNAAAGLPKVFCTTGAATAGAVHARVWGYKIVSPAN